MEDVLYLFHHLHYKNGKDEIHHCGGEHSSVDPSLNYTISHCACGKHQIDKKVAKGHTILKDLKISDVLIEFSEKCPLGGWHIESGKVRKE